jgi:hypothetical protein
MKNKFNLKLYLFLGSFLVLILILSYFIFFKTNPNISMVSGTEYISGEEGQIIVRLHDSKNRPISNADCVVSLLYPDKTFFIIDQEMVPTSVSGNYYISFITPQNPGVYEEHIVCDVSGKTLFVSSSFHVSTGLNLIAEVLETQQTQFQRVIGDILVTQEMLRNNLENLSSRMDRVEFKLNESIEENQASLLNKFSRMGGAMEEIFGNESIQ